MATKKKAEPGAPPEGLIRLRAPDGATSLGGPSGTAYQPDADGVILVAGEDVPALLRAGCVAA